LKNKRVYRLFAFAIFALVAGLLCLYVGLAWIFIARITHPACLETQYLDDFKPPEEHWLSTEDGHIIRVWYYPSKNGAAILSLGGLTGSLGSQLPEVAFLVKNGYGVLQIDSRACMKPPTPVTLGGDEIYDAAAGLDFLLARSEVDPNKIGAIGFSMGGATAIRAAARHPVIKAVIRDGGFSNLGAMLDGTNQSSSLLIRLFYKTSIFFYEIQTGIDPWTVSPLEDLSNVSPRPVLLIYGQYEQNYGLEQFEKGGDGKILWIVPSGRHGQNHLVAPEEYEQRILDFFAQNFENEI
jgi:dipeptidyl aminopeptidase/acylaminoacyl peptidase